MVVVLLDHDVLLASVLQSFILISRLLSKLSWFWICVELVLLEAFFDFDFVSNGSGFTESFFDFDFELILDLCRIGFSVEFYGFWF